MNGGREVILERIRSALAAGGVGGGLESETRDLPEAFPPPRNYRHRGMRDRAACIELFRDRLLDYGASVSRCRPEELKEAISSRIHDSMIRSLAVPQDLPRSWTEGIPGTGVHLLLDRRSEPLSKEALESTQGVLTGCSLAIAETGTLVFDGGPTQGRRVLSLLPDYHLCVVFAQQVLETFPEAWAALGETREAGPPALTLVSGPSATSDIELVRVEGVHGPRTLDVILVEDE